MLPRNAFLNFLFVEILRLNLTALNAEANAGHRTSRAYLLALESIMVVGAAWGLVSARHH